MSEAQQQLPIEVPESKPKRAPTLYFIVAFKCLKGLAALLFAVFTFSIRKYDLPEAFHKLLEYFHIDPEKKFFLELADRIGEITTSNLEWAFIVSTAYGLFMLLQAVGLALRVSWIVWLVILESAFFIPIEVFELVRRHASEPAHHPHRLVILGILLANIAIVWYLSMNRERIIRHHQH